MPKLFHTSESEEKKLKKLFIYAEYNYGKSERAKDISK